MKRKIAFSHSLRRKADKPEVEAEMSPEQIKAFDRAVSDALRWLGNVQVALLDHSPEQEEFIAGRIGEISAQTRVLEAKIS